MKPTKRGCDNIPSGLWRHLWRLMVGNIIVAICILVVLIFKIVSESGYASAIETMGVASILMLFCYLVGWFALGDQ